MAGIIGGFSKNNEQINIGVIPFSPTFSLEQKHFSIYASGNLLYDFMIPDKETIIVCGSGIDENNNLMTVLGWQKKILKSKIEKLNGHYLVIRIQQNKVTVENDQLGLREMYFLETENAVYFSTRLDWITDLRKINNFNLDYLCSLWNFENPLLFETLVDKVTLLGAGGKATISQNGLSRKNQRWIPQRENAAIQDVVQNLESLL